PPGTSITFTTMLLIPEGKTAREIFEESQAEPPGAGTRQVRVSPGYLRALGARLVAGEWLDERAGAAPAVLVSRPYADHYFPDGNAVGASMTVIGFPPESDSVVTIAGVVGDIHLRQLAQVA